MMNAALNYSTKRHERGSTLIVALVMLVVLGALAASALQSSTMEQRMSVNSLEQNVAFEAAETGLKAGEAVITSLTAPDHGTAGCTGPCVTTLDNVNGGIYANATGLPWGNFTTYPEIATLTTYSGAAAPPQYIIEYIGFMVDPNSSLKPDSPVLLGSDFYRITAMGVGSHSGLGAEAIVQSIYARRF